MQKMLAAVIALSIVFVTATVFAATQVPTPGIATNPIDSPTWPPPATTTILYDDGTILLANGKQCLNWIDDLNKDCSVNSGDTVLLSSHVGAAHNPWTVTPTYTPTATPTATPQPNTVATIIADKTMDHDGVVCNTTNFDWQYRAADQGATPTSVSIFPKATGWGVFEWDCNAGGTANVTVETQNVGAWVFNDSNTWYEVTNDISWCAVMDTTTSTFADNSDCGSSSGPTWAMPTTRNIGGNPALVALHWASDHTTYSGTPVCTLTTYQARISGSGAANAYIMANAGFDYWKSDPNAQNPIDSSFVGRFRRLTTNWFWINGTTCTSTVLTNYPPPLN